MPSIRSVSRSLLNSPRSARRIPSCSRSSGGSPMDARKKIVTVTVSDEASPLDAAVASLTQNIGAKRAADEARVKEAQDKLKPVVAVAKAVLTDVEKLRAGYQEKLFSLTD